MSLRARAASAVPHVRAFEVPLVLAHLEYYFAFLIFVCAFEGLLNCIYWCFVVDIFYIDFLMWPRLARFSFFDSRI